MIGENQFYLDGRSCMDFGVVCSGSGTYGAPERDTEAVEIPGLDGAVLLDNGRYKNIEVSYPCFICRDFKSNMMAFRAWLLSHKGYRRLEDTYDRDHFRLAYATGGVDVETSPLNRGGNFNIAFDCKPQRWLKAGEENLALVSGQPLMNPTLFEALPLITIRGTGAGALDVGGTVVTINSMPDGVLILDCEEQNAYGPDGANRNNTISAPEFPVLPAGETPISWSGGINAVEIVPRWWTL